MLIGTMLGPYEIQAKLGEGGLTPRHREPGGLGDRAPLPRHEQVEARVDVCLKHAEAALFSIQRSRGGNTACAEVP